jgi:hypothetical protein
MAKIIIHGPGTTLEDIERERLLRNLERTPEERMELMFRMNAIALSLKKDRPKIAEGKGKIIIKGIHNEHP